MGKLNTVYMFNAQYGIILNNVEYLNLRVIEKSRTFEYPLESGETVIDHRIIMPIRIELRCRLTQESYVSAYNLIRFIYRLGTAVFMKARTSIYQNLILESMPHEEKRTEIETVTMVMSLKELQVENTQTLFAPSNPANSSTIDRGRVTSVTTSQTGGVTSPLL